MIKKVLLCLISFGSLATANAQNSNGLSVGEAFAINSEELLYRETHCQSDDKLTHKVLYKNADGESIAHKSIDYGNGFSMPSFKQTNFQTSEETEVIVDKNQVTLSFISANREQKQKTFEKNAFSDLPMVIDAGFDAFIRENWDSLVAGDKLYFQFPLVTRSVVIRLRASASSCSFESSNSQCFKLEMSNWLYRMLADPIELGYDRDQKQLIRYRGLSNIENVSGVGLDVDIRYSYGDLPLQACLEGTVNHG